MTTFQLLTNGLLGWALVGSAISVLGLYLQPRDFWRGFWFMNGVWCFIDGAIGWFGLFGTPPTPPELANLLLINSGLDVGYLIVGVVLLTRTKPILKGFGLAILVQGIALLAFDLAMYSRVSGEAL